MKKKNIVIMIFVVSLTCGSIILFYSSLISYFANDKNRIETYEDLSLYTENKYHNLYDYSIYVGVAKCSEIFFPKYEEFEYKDYLSNFYIFNGYKTLINDDLSFVLELDLKSYNVYNSFLEDELNRIEYTDEFNISYNEYETYVTSSSELTFFKYGKTAPYQLGLIAYNENTFKVRYIYFWTSFTSLEGNFTRIFKSTNCDW